MATQDAQVPQHHNDPLYRFPQWLANLRVLEVTEIKTVPYVPLSHPFVKRLIGTLRRECLDRTLFWTATDLEARLLDFQHYYNEHRTHAGRQGHPPVTGVNADRSLANLSCYRWQKQLSRLIPNADCCLSLVIRHQQEPLHLLAAILKEDSSEGAKLLRRSGVTLDNVLPELNRAGED